MPQSFFLLFFIPKILVGENVGGEKAGGEKVDK
jgi:hypothetical protein